MYVVQFCFVEKSMSETTQPHVLLVDDAAIYLSLAQILFARLAVTLVGICSGYV